MKPLVLSLFVLIIFCLSSCAPDHDKIAQEYFIEEANNNPEYSVAFETVGPAKNQPISLITQLNVAPEDKKMMALIAIINNSNEQLTLDGGHFTLQTGDGDFSQPSEAFDPITIEPGDMATQRLMFTPINNRRLFMKTGMRGDVNKNYELKVNLPSGELSSTFEMSSSQWDNYISMHSDENEVKLFFPSIDREAQQSYQVAKGKTDFIHADENEISVAGTNLQFNAFQVQDTFNLHIKIVNHGNDLLYVVPEHLSEILGDKAQLLEGQIETSKLDKSKRFIQKYQFYTPTAIDSFSVSKEFVVLEPNSEDSHLFAGDIKFEVMSL